MYSEARKGKRENFTGIDSPFEEPLGPDLVIKTNEKTIRESAETFLFQTRLLEFAEIRSSI